MSGNGHRLLRGLVVGMTWLACLGEQAATGVVNVLDHGATGDGTTLNTEALQEAIAACAENKGGTVLVPAGVYRTGPIELRSDVTLCTCAAVRLASLTAATSTCARHSTRNGPSSGTTWPGSSAAERTGWR